MRPLRIAFLDSWLQSPIEGSGTAVGIGGLADQLRLEGHTVERIAPPTTERWQQLPLTARRLLFNLALPRTFDPLSYDLIVGFDFDGFALRNLKRPYVCSIKGIIAEELQHERGRIRALFTLLSKLEGANARKADRVVSTSEYCRNRIAHHYGVSRTNIGVVPEGIDLGAWQRALLSATPRTDANLRVLCVARQYPRKHIADLLYAFARIRRYIPETRVRIVGDGPEHTKLMALAQRLNLAAQVDFLGALPDADLKREYAHADVFCLPSVQEGFGIVFLEAMVAGLPIVSTTAAAIPEVVRHGKTGMLAPPADPQNLAVALMVLLTERERRSAYGATAREIVQQYDWPQVSKRFLDQIKPLLDQEDQHG